MVLCDCALSYRVHQYLKQNPLLLRNIPSEYCTNAHNSVYGFLSLLEERIEKISSAQIQSPDRGSSGRRYPQPDSLKQIACRPPKNKPCYLGLQTSKPSVSNLTHYVKSHLLPPRSFSFCYYFRTLRVNCSAGTGINRYGWYLCHVVTMLRLRVT